MLRCSARWNFTVPGIRVIGLLGRDAANKSGIKIAVGATTRCEYCNQRREYCPPVRTQIYASGESQSINASVAATLTGECTGAAPPALTVHYFCTADGKSALRMPMLSVPVTAACDDGGRFHAKLKARTLPGEWVQLTVENRGESVAEDVELVGTLGGNRPANTDRLGQMHVKIDDEDISENTLNCSKARRHEANAEVAPRVLKTDDSPQLHTAVAAGDGLRTATAATLDISAAAGAPPTITASPPALVHQITRPGAQAKFPALLDYVGEYLVTSFSDQSDAFHEAGDTGQSFFSRDGTSWAAINNTLVRHCLSLCRSAVQSLSFTVLSLRRSHVVRLGDLCRAG